MRFYWQALIVAITTAAGVVGVGYLFGDHPNATVVGFIVALAVFVEGVEHLSKKADMIAGAIERVEESEQEDRG